jgi:hypothetical protein
MTSVAAAGPIKGHAGPVHSWTISTSVSEPLRLKFHSTSIPVVMPRTCV